MFSEVLAAARKRAGLSQEKLAETLSVSRQAIQKWESGTTMPDIGNLTAIAKYFDLSLDYLVRGKDNRSGDEMRITREVLPAYSKWSDWESYSKMLKIEYRQAMDEGKDVSAYEKLFDAVAAMPESKEKEDMADVLYRIVRDAPTRKDFPYQEPSELDAIRALRDGYTCPMKKTSKDKLEDKVLGGWLGRICGCLLGKPVEGIKTKDLIPVLKRTDNYPLHRYLLKEEMTDEVTKDIEYNVAGRCYHKDIGSMPVDDDTNYIVLGHVTIEYNGGRDFTSDNVMNCWQASQPKDFFCTAERVAYRNFLTGFVPPESAVYKNAYREWIGAQIRGDYFGYINPCNPVVAADMGWRDARISHVKNGIYGEMWVSAMIACAFGTNDTKAIVRGGLGQIPKSSRLYAHVSKVMNEYESGISFDDSMKRIHTDWDENDGYDWCHTISNAEIVTACLLWGEGNYTNSICMAVEQGFDTDCNGATVGSIVGVMIGGTAIPAQWTDPLCDTLETSVFGYGYCSIKDMAHRTMNHMPKEDSAS